MDESKKLYQIGKVSKICNIPIKTLRYYDEIELLIPRKIDPDSNYRYYSDAILANHSIAATGNRMDWPWL